MIKIKSLEYVLKRVQNAHPRTRKAQLNTILGLAIKGGGMLISLLLVPLTIDYLAKDTYGTWLTISSIVTMLAFLDIGIGNGLRNKFSEAVAKHDTLLARAYVSTAYLIFGLIQLVIILLFLLLLPHLPWQRIFNTNIDLRQLQTILLITVVAITIKLVLDILTYVLLALQESSRVSLINLLANLLVLVGTYMLSLFSKGNLIYLAALTVFCPVFVLLISGFVLYRNQLKDYRPSFDLTDFKQARSLLSLGYKFFFIQISVIILFYTDNIIINQLFGPAEVTTYNICFRYFNSINTLFAIAITPYWSAFTEAAVKADIKWMRSSYQYLQKLWIGLVIIIFLMILLSSVVYKFWIGSRVSVPLELNICMGVFTIVSCWNSIIAVVINGLSKIRLQLYFSLFSALINIPLAILLGKNLHMGSTGVILATSISLLVCSLFGGLQSKKLLSGTANGIWNQ
ncbi:lipopolysaccharide biosynthesis protein [Spirosoma validum]|uniref:Oligosaccharide flippase family protein n=1 Tax=Spirosoma validum TaxID=2771355 RepID=A0A927GBV2_9BACT|nr:oligosaccharide flippase family protein [Spirosoma validum]MBD2751870.1 oligosaccharide flippase family protein [Spirosoma validum]